MPQDEGEVAALEKLVIAPNEVISEEAKTEKVGDEEEEERSLAQMSQEERALYGQLLDLKNIVGDSRHKSIV